MLPFLKRNLEATQSGDDESQMRKPDEEAEYDSMHSAAEDLISAVHSKNVSAVAEALRAAFEMMESQPHEEGEHV